MSAIKPPVVSTEILVFLLPLIKMKKLLITLAAVVSCLFSSGQTMEVGLFGGISYYLGDLNPGKHFLQPEPAYGVLARYNLNSRWAFRAMGYRGHVMGDDAVSKTNENRNLKFRSRVTEFSLVAEFNFFEYFTGSKRDVVSPYIFGGAGVFLFDPEADGVALRDIGTEGQQSGFEGRSPYNRYSLAVPFGLGVKFSINSRLALTAEWGMRKTFTDYLDDVSKTYYLEGSQIDPANQAQVLSDPTFAHQPLMERGNPETRDWYNFSGVTLTYKFRIFSRKGCPDQQRNEIK
jgi:hypothetical protein